MNVVVAEILGPELLIVLVVAILLFGSSQLPKLARSVGQASKEFRKGVTEGVKDDADEPVTMTRAELDAMIAEREKAARED